MVNFYFSFSGTVSLYTITISLLNFILEDRYSSGLNLHHDHFSFWKIEMCESSEDGGVLSGRVLACSVTLLTKSF